MNVPHPPSEIPAHVQVKSLVYAVRWAAGIDQADFLSDELEGERWLAWASGDVRVSNAYDDWCSHPID